MKQKSLSVGLVGIFAVAASSGCALERGEAAMLHLKLKSVTGELAAAGLLAAQDARGEDDSPEAWGSWETSVLGGTTSVDGAIEWQVEETDNCVAGRAGLDGELVVSGEDLELSFSVDFGEIRFADQAGDEVQFGGSASGNAVVGGPEFPLGEWTLTSTVSGSLEAQGGIECNCQFTLEYSFDRTFTETGLSGVRHESNIVVGGRRSEGSGGGSYGGGPGPFLEGFWRGDDSRYCGYSGETHGLAE